MNERMFENNINLPKEIRIPKATSNRNYKVIHNTMDTYKLQKNIETHVIRCIEWKNFNKKTDTDMRRFGFNVKNQFHIE